MLQSMLKKTLPNDAVKTPSFPGNRSAEASLGHNVFDKLKIKVPKLGSDLSGFTIAYGILVNAYNRHHIDTGRAKKYLLRFIEFFKGKRLFKDNKISLAAKV